MSATVRYASNGCAMRIYELLNTHPPARRYGERSDGIRIQQKLCPVGSPSPSGRGGTLRRFFRCPLLEGDNCEMQL
ncbi:hypothetical protein [Prevotella pallens]|uniref:hypothetical protein n=1 Tax=Prevotella pallens TaxID=60133 RepID=UPI0028EE08F6|nr:hypothetical protein [Prevotella pallens]